MSTLSTSNKRRQQVAAEEEGRRKEQKEKKKKQENSELIQLQTLDQLCQFIYIGFGEIFLDFVFSYFD